MLELLAGIALGLAGSTHCLGMCGPIALTVSGASAPLSIDPTWKRALLRRSLGAVAYNGGRIFTYTLLGAIVGFGSSWFALAGLERSVSLIAGAAMLVFALSQLLLRKELLSGSIFSRFTRPVRTTLGTLLGNGSLPSHFGVGLLNGLLPCGMVTAALLGSVATGSILTGAVFMLGFGLGTTPLLSTLLLAGSTMGPRLRRHFRRFAPILTLIIATLFLLRGLGLGIPYLSPALASPGKPAPSCCAASK